MNKKYENIINLPHYTSPTRPRMSSAQRAAQFAPFAALTGYDAVIRETARQTEREIYLDDSEIEGINRCLNRIKAEIHRQPVICATCFIPDEKKGGGSYRMLREKVVKIDENLQKILLKNGETVRFESIIQLFME